jgi:putative membrane protein
LWGATIFGAKKMLQLNGHKKMAFIAFVGITLTSLTGIWVYFLMFIY